MFKNVSNFMSINKARNFIDLVDAIKISTCLLKLWEPSYHEHLYADNVSWSLWNSLNRKHCIENFFLTFIIHSDNTKSTHVVRYFISVMVVHPQNCYHREDVECNDGKFNGKFNLRLREHMLVMKIKNRDEKY